MSGVLCLLFHFSQFVFLFSYLCFFFIFFCYCIVLFCSVRLCYFFVRLVAHRFTIISIRLGTYLLCICLPFLLISARCHTHRSRRFEPWIQTHNSFTLVNFSVVFLCCCIVSFSVVFFLFFLLLLNLFLWFKTFCSLVSVCAVFSIYIYIVFSLWCYVCNMHCAFHQTNFSINN